MFVFEDKVKIMDKAYFAIASFCLILFALGVSFSDTLVLFWSCLIFQICSAFYTIARAKNGAMYLFYQLLFFLFLLGRYFVVIVFGYGEDYSGYYESGFAMNILNQIFISYFIALILMEISYRLYDIVELGVSRHIYEYASGKHSKRTVFIWHWINKVWKKFSKWLNSSKGILFLIGVIGLVLAATAKIHYYYAFAEYAREVGYTQSYLSTVPNYSTLIYLVGRTFEVFFFLIIALRPKVWLFGLTSVFYITIAAGELTSGRRMQLMQSVIIILVFFFVIYWPRLASRVKTIIVVSLLLIVPLTIIALQLVASYRYQIDKSKNIFNLALKFFYDQGISTRVVGNVIEYRNDLPKGRFYSLGPVIDLFNSLRGKVVHTRSSVDSALYGHVLSDAVSYFQSPSDYARGISLGSSYIAELYIDWKWIGVAIGSLLYGLLYRFIEYRISSKNIIVSMAALFIGRELVIAARSQYLKFLFGISPTNILLILTVLMITFLVSRLPISSKFSDSIQRANIFIK